MIINMNTFKLSSPSLSEKLFRPLSLRRRETRSFANLLFLPDVQLSDCSFVCRPALTSQWVMEMSRAAETSVQGFKFIFSEGSNFYLLNAAGAPYVTPSSHEITGSGWSFQHYFSLVPSVQNHHWLHALPWFQSADWCSFSATDRAGHMFHFNDPPMKIRRLTFLTFIWRFYTILGMWWLNNQSGWQHCQGLRASVSPYLLWSYCLTSFDLPDESFWLLRCQCWLII